MNLPIGGFIVAGFGIVSFMAGQAPEPASSKTVAIVVAPADSERASSLANVLLSQFQTVAGQARVLQAGTLDEAKRQASDQKAAYLIFAEVPAAKSRVLGGITKALHKPLGNKAKPDDQPASIHFAMNDLSGAAAAVTLDLEASLADDEIGKRVAAEFGAKIQDDREQGKGAAILQANRPRLIVQTAHSSQVIDFVYSRDGQVAATLGADGVLKIWSAASGKELRTFAGYRLNGVAISPDGASLATVDQKGTVRIVNTHLGVIERTIPNPTPPNQTSPSGYFSLSGKVTPIVYSPDGRLIVHGGSGGAWVLDARAGRRLGTIGPRNEVAVLALDPSGQSLAVLLPNESNGRDSGAVALAHGDGAAMIQIYDTSTRNPVGEAFPSYVGTVTAMAFDSSGGRLFVGSRNGSIRIFNPKSGDEFDKEPMLVNRCDKPYEVDRKVDAIEKKKKRFGDVTRYIPGADKLEKLEDARKVQTKVTHTAGKTCEALQVANKLWAGGFASMFQLSPAEGIRSIDLSADGKILAYGLNDNSIKVHTMGDGFDHDKGVAEAEGDKKPSAEDKGPPRILFGNLRAPVKVSFDGTHYYVSAIREFKTVNRWDAGTGEQVSSIAVAKRDLNPFIIPLPLGASAQFSKDGKHMLTASLTNGSKLWDLNSGMAEFSNQSPILSNRSNISADGTLAVDFQVTFTNDEENPVTAKVVVKEVESGKNVFECPDTLKSLAFTALSADGKLIGIAQEQGALKVYDVKTAKVVFTAKSIHDLNFSPDSSLLVLRTEDQSLSVIKTADWSAGAVKASLKGEATDFFHLSTVIFDDQSAHIGLIDDDKIKVWDVPSGRLSETKLPFDGGMHDASGMVFAPGKQRISYTTDRSLYHWDYDTDKTTKSTLITDFWGNLSYSPDGRILALGGSENRVRLFDVDQDVEIGSLVAPSEHDWLMVTPDGRLDASRLEEIAEVHWVLYDDPLRAQPLELFSRDFYEPRLLPRLLTHEAFQAIPDLAARNRALPQMEITNISAAGDSLVKVTVEVRNAASPTQKGTAGQPLMSGAQRLRLFRDGRLVGSAPAADGAIQFDANGRAALEFTVALPHTVAAKKIDFSAYAFNSELAKSLTVHKDYELSGGPAAAPKGRAYVVAIGVNANQVETFRLKYAANDAALVSTELSKRFAQSAEYRDVVMVGLIADSAKTLDLAKKENIKAVLDVLAGRAAAVPRSLSLAIPATKNLKKATPDDLVLISFAGHGFADEGGKFYLLPSDLGSDQGTNISAYKPRAISSDELSHWLMPVDSHDLVMIIDACQSAAAVDSEGFKPGPMGSRGLGQLAYDKGMEILAATQKSNAAIEIDRLQHGVLTYALVQDGLIDKRADYRPVDHKIMLSEWLSYAAKRVPEVDVELRSGKLRGVVTSAPDKPMVQSPSLFNFQWNREDTLLATIPAP